MPDQEKLKGLPASEDKFWKLSKKKNVELKKRKGCDHLFKSMGGLEVECQKCGIGFILSKGFSIENGNLTFKGEVVI